MCDEDAPAPAYVHRKGEPAAVAALLATEPHRPSASPPNCVPWKTQLADKALQHLDMPVSRFCPGPLVSRIRVVDYAVELDLTKRREAVIHAGEILSGMQRSCHAHPLALSLLAVQATRAWGDVNMGDLPVQLQLTSQAPPKCCAQLDLRTRDLLGFPIRCATTESDDSRVVHRVVPMGPIVSARDEFPVTLWELPRWCCSESFLVSQTTAALGYEAGLKRGSDHCYRVAPPDPATNVSDHPLAAEYVRVHRRLHEKTGIMVDKDTAELVVPAVTVVTLTAKQREAHCKVGVCSVLSESDITVRFLDPGPELLVTSRAETCRKNHKQLVFGVVLRLYVAVGGTPHPPEDK